MGAKQRPQTANSIPQNGTAGAAGTAPAVPPKDAELVNLEREKARLEIEKLREEIATEKHGRSWWRKSVREVKLSEWAIGVSAVIALIVAFSTGVFNATRDRLAAQGDRLEVEKVHLEDRREKLSAEVASKEKELEALRGKLGPFEQEQSAIKELLALEKSKNVRIRFETTEKFDGLKVTIVTGSPNGLVRWDFFSPYRTERNPAIHPALNAVNRLRSVHGVRTEDAELTLSDIDMACRHDELRFLAFRSANLKGPELAEVRGDLRLTRFDLSFNRITSLASCPRMDTVQTLALKGNPLADAEMATLAELFPGVEHLNLEETQVTDQGLEALSRLKNLRVICLKGTKVTGPGLKKLFSCPDLFAATINGNQVTDDLQKQFDARYNSFNFNHEDSLVFRRLSGEWD